MFGYEEELQDEIALLKAENEKLKLRLSDVSISLERAKKYARHQHYRGSINEPFVEFEDWAAKD